MRPREAETLAAAGLRSTYRTWTALVRESLPGLRKALHELEGRDLVCWCAPLPCHRDVLLRLLALSPL
jgi:hypothetical protein